MALTLWMIVGTSLLFSTAASLSCGSPLFLDEEMEFDSCSLERKRPEILGIRSEGNHDEATVGSDGVLRVEIETPVTLRVMGSGLTSTTFIRLTDEPALRGADCTDVRGSRPLHLALEEDGSSGVVSVILENGWLSPGKFYICVKDISSPDPRWFHMGTAKCTQLRIKQHQLPCLLRIIAAIMLQIFSGLFAGLTLGLLSLNVRELKFLAKMGPSPQKDYAKNILPLRRQSSFLLCSLAIGNVLVNCSLTVLMDDMTSGTNAVILSTLGIVIFGEIFPQALCSRFGLMIGSKTRWFTWMVMMLTSPVSFPLSCFLDLVLDHLFHSNNKN